MSGTSVAALLTLPSGDVVVGGTFTSVGPGVAAQNIAIYRPATNTWQSVGGITGGSVPTVASLALTASGDVLVGGRFTTAGGVPAGNIARYRPSTGAWSAVGGGVLDLVYALMELPGGDLLHGSDWGLFRFNSATQTWTRFSAEDVFGTLALATLPDGSVLVGGRQTQLLERYRPDPAPLGSSASFAGGVNGEVRAILVLPSGLVWVGGTLAQANSQNLVAYAVPGTLPAFARQPAPMLTVVGGTAVFDLSASALGAVTFRWQKDGVPLDIVANPTAATPILHLSNLQPSDAGSYVCIVTGSCNDLPLGSAPATLTFPGPAGPADFNNDGVVDLFDYLDFVQEFSIGC
ncbi:MAG: immunoglobulin domain-containing protein [Planctomycetes bacterium]|nr:immunoglobulin domain-containing protein [Planctomycetota bacterium]